MFRRLRKYVLASDRKWLSNTSVSQAPEVIISTMIVLDLRPRYFYRWDYDDKQRDYDDKHPSFAERTTTRLPSVLWPMVLIAITYMEGQPVCYFVN